MMRAPRLRLLWPVLLLLMFSPLPVRPAEVTSPESSPPSATVPLQTCLDELMRLEQKSIEQVTRLESDFAERLRLAVTVAAAEAVKPVLVELAGVTAERDAYRRVVLRWQIAAVGVGVGAAALGFLFGVLLHLRYHAGAR